MRRDQVQRHAPEYLGERLLVPRVDELAYGELVEDYSRRELPVTGVRRVPHGFGETAVPLIPLCRLPVQPWQPVRVLDPELQAQHLGEHRMVAKPSVPERPDERVSLRQRHQRAAGLRVTG